MSNYARITAIGTYVPDQILTNADLERMVDTTDEWIVQRTGIRERRISAPSQYTSDLCVSAAENLVNRYNKVLDDVDFIIVATSTPDFSFPSTACLVQHKLRLPSNVGALDISAACSGFVYGLHLANGLIASGLHRKVLVIGADTISKITDYTDRTTCILFGDGAGAVLVEKVEEKENASFLAYHMGTEGGGGVHVYQSGLSNQIGEIVLTDTKKLVQNGREVFRWVARTIPDSVKELLAKADASLEQVDWFVPHSANLRLIEPVCEKLGFPMEKTLYSLVQYGNTSAATIPLALDLGVREEKVKAGDTAVLYGFGAGLTHAGALIRWNPDPL